MVKSKKYDGAIFMKSSVILSIIFIALLFTPFYYATWLDDERSGEHTSLTTVNINAFEINDDIDMIDIKETYSISGPNIETGNTVMFAGEGAIGDKSGSTDNNIFNGTVYFSSSFDNYAGGGIDGDKWRFNTIIPAEDFTGKELISFEFRYNTTINPYTTDFKMQVAYISYDDANDDNIVDYSTEIDDYIILYEKIDYDMGELIEEDFTISDLIAFNNVDETNDFAFIITADGTTAFGDFNPIPPYDDIISIDLVVYEKELKSGRIPFSLDILAYFNVFYGFILITVAIFSLPNISVREFGQSITKMLRSVK